MKFLEAVTSVIILRAAVYIEGLGVENSLQHFPRLQRIVSSLEGADLSLLVSDTDAAGERYKRVLELISDGTDDVEQSVLDLCLASMHVPEFEAYLKHHLGSGVTLKLAYDLESQDFPDYSDMIGKADRLSRIFYIDRYSQPIQHYDIRGDDRLFAYITGDDSFDARLSRCCSLFRPEDALTGLFVRRSAVFGIEQALEAGETIIQVSGREGRSFAVKHALKSFGCEGLFFDYSALEDYSEDSLELTGMMVLREALFRECCLVVTGLTSEGFRQRKEQPAVFFKRFVLRLAGFGLPVVLCTAEDLDFALTQEQPMVRIKLTGCTASERETFWQGILDSFGMEADASYMANKYRLSPGETERALRMLAASGGSLEDEGAFANICYDISTAGLERSLGKVTMPDASLSELKAEKSVIDTITQICANSRCRVKVYEDWGLGRLFRYGKTISVLMAGPPGTGKTMTANIIAGELKLPLYQINISAVVDKYIGETEKHLESIFDFAEKTDTVLFFDEADAIFGKRSEVNDSHDRYANTSVSYILQRIEQYEGIVLLATNLVGNIDPAFMRRIKYMLRFNTPDPALRREIWRQCLTPELETEGEIDIDFLAEQFELAGGPIKNVMQNACFLSASEGRPLSMYNILKSIKGELVKENRNVIKSFWGKYAYLIDD